MTLSALALTTSRVVGIELEVDRGDERAVFVAAGDQPSVDLADIGLMGVAADHDVDRVVELLDDVDDRRRRCAGHSL